jgi:putative ABC transport system permease protein
MRIIETIRGFINDLLAQKLRTVLTISGVTWGTVAIIVLLAFGNGFQRQTMITMNGIGESIILLFPGQTAKPYKGYGIDRDIYFTERDVEILREKIKLIQFISPEYSNWNAPLRVEDRRRSPNVTGIIPEYGIMRNILPVEGSRFINAKDMEFKRRTVFLGNDLAGFLFQDEDPVGKYVYIADTPFRVVGVMKEKEQDSSYNSRDKDRAFIPAATFQAMFGYRFINNMVIKTVNPHVNQQVIDRVYEVLGRKYKFDPSDKEALSIWDTSEFQKMFLYIFIGFHVFMGIIGAFTLTVGGIGVANIMFVVVQERTREIGIKRSVGAKRFQIMSQFFLETFFVIGIGALIGLLISLLILGAMSLLPIDDFVGRPSLSWWVALVALSILTGIGFIAGYFPAKKAANLQVINCLRY